MLDGLGVGGVGVPQTHEDGVMGLIEIPNKDVDDFIILRVLLGWGPGSLGHRIGPGARGSRSMVWLPLAGPKDRS